MMHVVKVWLASAIKITCTMLQFRYLHHKVIALKSYGLKGRRDPHKAHARDWVQEQRRFYTVLGYV